MSKIKSTLKKYIPPVFLSWYKVFFDYGYFGNYKNWDEAKEKCGRGYNSDLILEKVKDALMQVKTGKAKYERDSVIFENIEYSWPLLSSLLWIASKSGNFLEVVDYGGSLGSTYYQNKFFLTHLQKLTWSIVEQKNFVLSGKQNFENQSLKFWFSLADYLDHNEPQTIIFSSVLQYLDEPYKLLKKVIDSRFKYIIVDRTTFLCEKNHADRIVIQKVPKYIYKASYPCWFFNKNKFLDFLCQEYDLIAEFDSLGGKIDEHGILGINNGFIFELKKDI